VIKVAKINVMKVIKPWINFNGNAEEAFNFYKTIFGGELTKVIRFKDIASEEFQVAENDAEKIMRIDLGIGGVALLTGNDVPEFMGKVNENENRSKIYIEADSKDEAEKIVTGLSEGGQMEVPIEGSADDIFAMFRDKYGIEWIVEFNTGK
jgi:PhnB protein